MTEPDHEFDVRNDGQSIVYGPSGPDNNSWTLIVNTEAGETVHLDLAQGAMYELWEEVHNVPWPSWQQRTGSMRREIVERIETADADTLKHVVDVLYQLQDGATHC